MNSEFFDALDMLEEQKGIPKDYMLAKVEAALQSAFKKEVGPDALVKIVIDNDKKEIKMFREYNIVETVINPETEIDVETAKTMNRHYKLGGVADEEIKMKNLRRLSAQAAKQVIIQGIREAERTNTIREYESKTEEIITATVMRVDEETGNVTVDTGTSIARILKSDLIPGDNMKEGKKIKVCLTELRHDSTSGPIVTLSRSHPDFIKRLFALEVPEVHDGTVEIVSIAREAGSRTKVAVKSNDPSVEAVGACIGQRSMRIGRILNEIANEKIDLIRYSDDPFAYIKEALSPAQVQKVVMLDVLGDEENNEKEGKENVGWKGCARAVVDEDHLSLAIGKDGQNVRLAARLTGYKIDIKTTEA